METSRSAIPQPSTGSEFPRGILPRNCEFRLYMAGIQPDYPPAEILARPSFPGAPRLHFPHYRAMIARAEGAILLTIFGVNAKSVRGSAGASKFRAILDLRCRPPCRGIGGDPWRKPRIRYASGDMAMPASHVMKRGASTNQAMRHQAVRRQSWPSLE